MLLIVEVALTIAAWTRGWYAWSLLPLGIALLMGVLIGAAGGTPAIAILGDLACLSILGYMLSRTPPQAEQVPVITTQAKK